MKRMMAAAAVAASLAGGAFVGGTWWAHRAAAAGASAPDAHAAAAFSCPMHPDYRTGHPGSCPICGMPLESVAAAGTTGAGGAAPALPPGTVRVSPERQQTIGVRLGVVTRLAGTRLLRTTGRVVPDENRTYPIVAAVSGWVRKVENVATGDVVKKDQVLASISAPESQFENAQQSYYTGLEMLYRDASVAPQPHDSGRTLDGIERVADGLRNLGVSNAQLREMGTRRSLVSDIRVESPVNGVVLTRSVSPGLRFDRGFELYRIANLDRVWILADVPGRQLPFIGRGTSVRITTPDGGQATSATVTPSEPTFDETALTLKVRLEAANPRRTLKPGMFVDVEFPIDLPAALVVPADAIVDSGLRKTVFVDRGTGDFEPRLVETGWRIGDDIEVTKGLMPGERIVISGTFFIDSESRMKAAPRASTAPPALDPVCGMPVDPRTAGHAGRSAAHGGHRFYFCSDTCQRQFVADPSGT
jgi:membrane fusion protein, copper/silver efflux system